MTNLYTNIVKVLIGEVMKEIKVLLGIFFIVIGSIIFEMNLNNILSLFGFLLVAAGVFIYVLVVDSLEKTKNHHFDFDQKDFY